MTMPDPGDVGLVNFPMASGVKRRPAVVVSSATYLKQRPDVAMSLLTSNVAAARTSTDYALQDWAAAGLRKPTVFRVFFSMFLPWEIQVIGKLSPKDWQQVKVHLSRAIG